MINEIKKSIGYFCVALGCLGAGAGCHGLRTSGDPVKFKIGVVIGVIMIIAAITFGVAGIVVAVKNRRKDKV